METRPPHDTSDAVAPSDADVLMPAMNSADVREPEHDDGVIEPRQNTESHDAINEGDSIQGEDLSENGHSHTSLTVNNLLNLTNDNPHQQDDMRAAETASVVSDLSTQAFRENLHRDLCSALDAIKSAGSFANFFAVKVAELPAISVDGVGEIRMPLQDDQAQQFINHYAARQAPGSSVGNPWEFDASQLQFRNPESWVRMPDRLCKMIAESMGITSPISAELHKMLIYEKGAVSNTHANTEQIPGMFGTMMLCLPSRQDGDLVVEHAGNRMFFKAFKTFEGHTTTMGTAFWYSDVSYEVLPAPSGYRWALAYNLTVAPELERPSASLLRSETKSLRHTLRRWILGVVQRDEERRTNENPDLSKVTEELFYFTDYNYTEDDLSKGINGLVHSDRARVQCLQNLANELGFEVYLADVEKMERGIVEMNDGEDEDEEEDENEDEEAGKEKEELYHIMEEVLDSSVDRKMLVNLKGQEIDYNTQLDIDILYSNLVNLVYDPFDDIIPKETDYEPYDPYRCNNASGPQATHWYRTQVTHFLNYGVDGRHAESLLNEYTDQIADRDPKTRYMALKMTRVLAMKAWLGPKSVTSINKAICTEVVRILRKRQSTLYSEVLGWLNKRSDEATFHMLRGLWMTRDVRICEIQNCVNKYITGQSLKDQLELLRLFVPHPGREAEREAQASFILDIVKAAVDKCRTRETTEDDGTPTTTLTMDSVLPVLELRASQGSPFALAAIQRFWEHAVRGGPFGGDNLVKSAHHYKRLAKSFVTNLPLKHLRGRTSVEDNWGYEISDLVIGHIQPSREQQQAWDQTVKSTQPPTKKPAFTITPSNLSKFFGTCLENNLNDLLLQLTFKILAEAETLPWYDYRSLWLPFLYYLIPVLETAGVPLTTPRYQQIAGAILDTFLENYVKPKPRRVSSSSGAVPAAPSLARPPVRCECTDCHLLNRFLTSETQSEVKFNLTEARLYHVERYLELSASGVEAVRKPTPLGSSHPSLLVITKTSTTNGSRFGNRTASTSTSASARHYSSSADSKKARDRERARKEWERRAKVAIAEINRFPQEKLKLLLGGDGLDGGDKLAKLREMAPLRNRPDQDGGDLLALPTPSNPALVVGVRRRREDDDVGASYGNARKRIS